MLGSFLSYNLLKIAVGVANGTGAVGCRQLGLKTPSKCTIRDRSSTIHGLTQNDGVMTSW